MLCWIAYGWVALSTALDGFALGGLLVGWQYAYRRLQYGVDEFSLNEKNINLGVSQT